MKINVAKHDSRKVVAYRGTTSGDIYLKSYDGKTLVISPEGRHNKLEVPFSSLARSPSSHQPLYEGDVVEIVL